MANINSIKLPDGTTYDINAKTVAGKTVQTDVPANAVFTDTTYSPFTGTDGTEAGVAGLVPAPSTSDADKVLKGDGTWGSIAGGVTQTASDSNDAEYELLFSETADNTTRTEGARKTQYAKINPNKKAFTLGTRLANSTVGNFSVAEGNNNTASGNNSHAEGDGTIASGIYSHAENSDTIASGKCSHAEGDGTIASGKCSHAEGDGTIAQRKSQHVFGEYNIADTQGTTTERGDYVEIVGNGLSSTQLSNARTLDWDGNQYIAGTQTDKNGVQTTKSLTQAEYDALTPAQKSDGTVYYITDAISTEESELWSRVGRGTLHTDAQVISNAVNELVDKTDDTNDAVETNTENIATNTEAISQLNSSLAQRAFVGSPKSISVTIPAGGTVHVDDANYAISGKTYIGTLIYSYEGAHVSITTGYAGNTVGIRFVVHNFNSSSSLTITINYRHIYI